MQTTRKKLIIAIPTYNRREYLLETIRSIEAQSFKDIWVIIFDNASNYDIHDAVKIFDKMDIQIERSEVNIGNIANFKRIYGYNFDADYLMVFHDDDTIHPSYIEEVMKQFNADKDLVWIGSALRFISDSSKMSTFKPIPQACFHTVDTQELLKAIFEGWNLSFDSVVYNNTYFQQANIRDEKFDKWLDRPLLVDLSLLGKVAMTYDKFINYRIHQGQDSQNTKAEDLEKQLGLFQYYKDLVRDEATLRAFRSWATNNALFISLRRSANAKEFADTLSAFKRRGFFRLSHLGIRGIYYVCKFFLSKIIRK